MALSTSRPKLTISIPPSPHAPINITNPTNPQAPSTQPSNTTQPMPKITICSPSSSPFLQAPSAHSTTPTALPLPASHFLIPHSCLQCHLSSLPCSYSTPHHLTHAAKSKLPIVSCTRCLRNGEDFCIRRVPKEQEFRILGLSEWEKFSFVAEKIEGVGKGRKVVEVERELLRSKVEELREEKEGKRRWMLPRPENEEGFRSGLKPMTRRFRKDEDQEEEGKSK